MPSTKTPNGIFLIDDPTEEIEESRKGISSNFNIISQSLDKVNKAEEKFDAFKKEQDKSFKDLKTQQDEAIKALKEGQTKVLTDFVTEQKKSLDELKTNLNKKFDTLKENLTDTTNTLIDNKIHKYGLGDTGSQPLSNLDDMTTPQGFYKTVENTTTGTFPVHWGGKAKHANVVVERLDQNWIKQTITEISEDGTPLIYYRTNKHSNNTWHPWVFLMNETNAYNTGWSNKSRIVEASGLEVDLVPADNFIITVPSNGVVSFKNVKTGQSGVLIMKDANKITGWAANVKWRKVPTNLQQTEIFAYFVSTDNNVYMGRA
jgi:hypothetical protein